jgi:DNA-binding transcriptional LysR family regulator
MNQQQLSYFLTAAERGSFSAAAEALGVAQPSLSDGVRRLERDLGAELFSRAGRGIVLTEAGRALRPHAEEILQGIDQAREAVQGVHQLRGGTASFGIFGTAGFYILADLVNDFRRLHPNVRVRLIGQNSTEVADAVRDGRLEAGLVVLPVDDRGLDVRPVLLDEVLYVSSRLDRLREPMTIERLAAAPLILYDARYGWSDPTRRQLMELAQSAGVKLEPAIDIEDLVTSLDLVKRGLGDTIIARGVALGHRFPKGVGSVPFAEPIYDTFAFISRAGSRLSPATRALVTLAERRLDELRAGLVAAGQDPARVDPRQPSSSAAA